MNARLLQPDELTDAVLQPVSHLASQLRGDAFTVSRHWRETLLSVSPTWLVVVQDEEGKIVGMLTLSAFPRISGWTPWIEGVVVDEAARGQGYGRALVEKAIATAHEQGFETINRSCRPHRTAANALYESVGFEVVPTNYRRLKT